MLRSGSGAARAGRPGSSKAAASSSISGRSSAPGRRREPPSSCPAWWSRAWRTAEELKGAVAPFRDDLQIVLERDGGKLEPGESLSLLTQREGVTVASTSTRPGPGGRPQHLRIHARPLGRPAGVVLSFADRPSGRAPEGVGGDGPTLSGTAKAGRTAATTMIATPTIATQRTLQEEHELLGRDWFDAVVPAADRLDAGRAFARVVSGVEPPRDSLETFVRTNGGDDRKIAWRNSTLRDEDGEIVGVLRSGEDVTERRRAEAQVAYLAYHDALTGLPNRTQLEEQLRTDLAWSRRSGEVVALLYFDLDNFKLVNDSLGHAAGNEVLLLMHCPGAESASGAAQLAAERIAGALERPFEVSDAEFHIGASIGVALCPEHADDAERLLKCADAAMYQAKRSGSGTIAVYREEQVDARARLSLTARLRRAVAEGELRLFYQPIVALGDAGADRL